MSVAHLLTLTRANLDHGHLYLTGSLDMFPADTLGGTSKAQAAPRTVRVHCGLSVVETDIARDKRIFRRRCFRGFFAEFGLGAGDRVLLEQLGPYEYRLSNAAALICLSIQQPWADLILDGRKLVENRNTFWTEAAQALEADAVVRLGIHVSKQVNVWEAMKDRERFVPGWRPEMSKCAGGMVHGIVDVVQICRYHDLPTDLKSHPFVFRNYQWHWVLRNPRKLVTPFQCKGNSSLFYPFARLRGAHGVDAT